MLLNCFEFILPSSSGRRDCNDIIKKFRFELTTILYRFWAVLECLRSLANNISLIIEADCKVVVRNFLGRKAFIKPKKRAYWILTIKKMLWVDIAFFEIYIFSKCYEFCMAFIYMEQPLQRANWKSRYTL